MVQHMVHQHLNRRIGLEYAISGFEVPGSPLLLPPQPAGSAEIPVVGTSLNSIQEYRPDYTKTNEDAEIRELLDLVVEEVWGRWNRGGNEGEQGVDREKVCNVRILHDQILTHILGSVQRQYLLESFNGAYRDLICTEHVGSSLIVQKRWQEQLARERGETHRDEISRRKQNQYRRQQSVSFSAQCLWSDAGS